MTTMTKPAPATGARTLPRVVISAERCAGCQECVVRCPTGALGMDTTRWIAAADDARCVGCRQCERTCPFSAIQVEGPMLAGERIPLVPIQPQQLRGSTAELRPPIGSWEDALAEAARCLTCPDPTCVRGCPAHNDIPAFIAAVRDHNLEGAQEILARTSVLPDICSRVCNQAAQCEGACSWSLAGARATSSRANAPRQWVGPLDSLLPRAPDLLAAKRSRLPTQAKRSEQLACQAARLGVRLAARHPPGVRHRAFGGRFNVAQQPCVSIQLRS